MKFFYLAIALVTVLSSCRVVKPIDPATFEPSCKYAPHCMCKSQCKCDSSCASKAGKGVKIEKGSK